MMRLLRPSRFVAAFTIVWLLLFLGPCLATDEATDDLPDTRILTQTGVAMEPTIKSEQQVSAYRNFVIDRFDIVVYVPPTDATVVFIGRIVGLPGDVVSIEEGDLLIDGEQIEDAVNSEANYHLDAVQIPSGNYFILGDNRSDSYDSHVFGPVNEDSILAEVRPLQ